jgi:hypothetical protein
VVIVATSHGHRSEHSGWGRPHGPRRFVAAALAIAVVVAVVLVLVYAGGGGGGTAGY